jgi:hypothetical protein
MSVQKNELHVRFEVFTAVTMKKGVFWDVTPCGSCKNLKKGVFWDVTPSGSWKNLKKGVFWDVTPCDSCKNRRKVSSGMLRRVALVRT